MKGGAAHRYAKALFGLAQDEHRHREVRAELDNLASLFEGNRDASTALLTPMHPADERKAALRAIGEGAGVSGLVQNFVAFLIDQRRLIDFAAIVDAYGELADAAEGMVTAAVVIMVGDGAKVTIDCVSVFTISSAAAAVNSMTRQFDLRSSAGTEMRLARSSTR